ncbi:hypothetical protein ASE36_11825 [Rhizobium sp. Root274]|uniref:DUF423 domain-containing protein n=1 Tax=unclassified Rhizobium TaxID=2613769 RepID=UPI000715002C|nr:MULTISPECIES: DUF423 domain-containing protein [unclassified Rhizobium]KQW29144.1 hypothetical protein ASC71_11845 [Rhizobium sp. Root1240]KRD29340.1 hypothetical protein ASE36_11825 [Rhizobium sp. Root274]
MANRAETRWSALGAGLIGAAGVGLAAAASHAGGEALLRPASTICLAHAPALLALSLAGDKIRAAGLVALGMIIGTLLFSGDLVARHFLGSGLFPMAAPTGGLTLIASWLLLAGGAALRRP